jgi:ABC-type nickel/cobalt efflux system permease component RcnA
MLTDLWHDFAAFISTSQTALFRALSGAVDSLASGEPVAVMTAIGIAFAYGVAHATGPGHGKALIAAYVGASRETILRGVALSAMGSFLQAGFAIAIVAALAIVFDLSRRAVLAEAVWIERASAVLTAALGLYLIVSAVRRILKHRAAARAAAETDPEDGHVHDPLTSLRLGGAPDCCAPETRLRRFVAEDVTAKPARLQTLALILSMASRPCSGSIFVLLLALSQGVFLMGIAAALAIGLGTAVTVSAAAIVTVLMRDGALKLATHSGSAGVAVWLGSVFGLAGGVTLILIAFAILNAPQSPFGPMPST